MRKWRGGKRDNSGCWKKKERIRNNDENNCGFGKE